jgi:hypothetical protein
MEKNFKHEVFLILFKCFWVAVYVHKLIFFFMFSLRFRQAEVFANCFITGVIYTVDKLSLVSKLFPMSFLPAIKGSDQ